MRVNTQILVRKCIELVDKRQKDRHDSVLSAIDSREFFGLNVAALTRQRALEVLETRLCKKLPIRLAFLNANLANTAYEDKNIQSMLHGFLLINDGSGMNLASRILYGKPFPDNLNGTDFTPYFLDHCLTPLRLFLLGGTPAVSVRAAEYFTNRWPQHTLVGHRHGYFVATEEVQILAAIREAQPSLVLVAMGNGLQERWVEKIVPEFAVSAWGVGALFDFLCKEVPRAPFWMRSTGTEWIYRLLLEPARMGRRYVLGNPKFVIRILRQLKSKLSK